MKSFLSLAAVAAIASMTSAEPVTRCDGNLCFSFAVPATESTGLFMQVTAPTTYSWAGIGTGSRMAGSEMFVIWADGEGNVTVSPRAATGRALPDFDPDREFEVLSGTGIADGQMTASIFCSSCSTGNSDWIYGYKSGDPIDSADPETRFNQHDERGGFSLAVSEASTEETNPFTEAITSETTGDDATGTTTGPDSTGTLDSSAPDRSVLYAHALTICAAWLVLYPIGSALMPLLGKWYIHAAVQMLAFLVMWVGFGLGLWVAIDVEKLFSNTHTIWGTIICCATALQPLFGWIHHQQFMKTRKKGFFSGLHIWYGRSLLVSGAVNGGLGLRLAGAPDSFIIAYVVVTVVMFVVYVASKIGGGMRESRKKKHDSIPMEYRSVNYQEIPKPNP